jgi:hypothetical protein
MRLSGGEMDFRFTLVSVLKRSQDLAGRGLIPQASSLSTTVFQRDKEGS